MKTKTTENFIERAKIVHGDKYDYSLVKYVKAKIPVKIICKKHGAFMQTPDKHLRGRGCRMCVRPNEGLTTDGFIKKCNEIHHGKYDYSKTIYEGYNKHVSIICPEHGEFKIMACNHFKGSGCQRCGGSGRYTTEEFIAKHISIFGDRYDYTKTKLEKSGEKVCIICREHGEYYKTITQHFRSGCPKCNVPNYRLDTNGFIEKAKSIHGDKFDYTKSVYKGIYYKVCVTCKKHGDIFVTPNQFLRGHGCKCCAVEESSKRQRNEASMDFERKARTIHGDKYNYSSVEYKTAHDKILIICPEHGEFKQTPNHHLMGNGCPKCSKRNWAYTTEEYVSNAQRVWENTYNYSKTIYVNSKTNITVICPEHGEFEINPKYHLSGGKCTICTALKIESQQETAVRQFLDGHGIRYIKEKQFKWLKRGRTMPLDFYLPDYKIAIECQGYQHFKPHVFFGGDEGFKDVVARDALKRQLCEDNGIRLLYYSDLTLKSNYYIIRDFNELLNKIQGKATYVQLKLEFEDW